MEDEQKAQKNLERGHEFFFAELPNIEAAVREFRRAIKLAPESAEGHGWLSHALREINQIDEAIAAVRTAIRLAPEDPRHHISLGVIFSEKEEYPEAIQAFRKGIALKMHYGEADAHLMLAEALFAEGQLEEACKEWSFVLTIEPMYPSYKFPHKEAKRQLKKYCKE